MSGVTVSTRSGMFERQPTATGLSLWGIPSTEGANSYVFQSHVGGVTFAKGRGVEAICPHPCPKFSGCRRTQAKPPERKTANHWQAPEISNLWRMAVNGKMVRRKNPKLYSNYMVIKYNIDSVEIYGTIDGTK